LRSHITNARLRSTSTTSWPGPSRRRGSTRRGDAAEAAAQNQGPSAHRS
jgi:hypothetical protein